MKKVLISENKEQAEQHLEWLRKTAKGITALLQSYNDLSILSNIETREQVKEFLDHPGEFLDHAILTETGITFSNKAQPLPDQVAGMFGITYSDGLTENGLVAPLLRRALAIPIYLYDRAVNTFMYGRTIPAYLYDRAWDMYMRIGV